jgi:large subunit ribosomal protein L24
MKLKKGDTVQVITGKDKGKKGTILATFREEGRVLVENVNIAKRHEKQTNKGQTGGVVEVARPIHASNVMLIDPKAKKPTRVGYKEVDGKKVRIAKKSGQTLA